MLENSSLFADPYETTADPQRREFLKKSATALALAAGCGLFGFGRIALARSGGPDFARAAFSNPCGLAASPDGKVLVADSGNYCVKVLDENLDLVRQFGRPGYGPGLLNFPAGIAAGPDGSIIVADTNNGRICRFDARGSFLDSFGSLGGTPGHLFTPAGVCSGRAGKIFVANTRGHNVQVFDSKTGAVVASWGILGDDPAGLSQSDKDYAFRLPTAVRETDDGRILVLDSKHGHVKVLDRDGGFLGLLAGTLGRPGELLLPMDAALAPSGDLYVADTGHRRVVRISVRTGKLTAGPSNVGRPRSLDIGPDGKLYVLDSEEGRVIRMEAF